jgi:hypothetical protein
VLFVVLEVGFRVSRWNGESMVNSSCRASPEGISRGIRRSCEYSESSMLKV